MTLLDSLNGIINNKILWIAVVSWMVAQIIKVILYLIKFKRINFTLFVASGGMPSSHTSFVTALTTAVGMSEGFDSPVFAVAAVLSLVVMYDAAGVRRAAGKQAAVLNQLVESGETTGFWDVKLDKKLKELLGHSPIQVAAGAFLGVVTGIIAS